jgi:pimeloyl-ACP methyl ester carboxylesterase/predicted glycosyltransferase
LRAREPDREGFVDRDGVKLHYEVFGAGEPTLMLLPSNPIVHSRQWKAQVPYLARHYRVVTFDGRGNGRSDRPVTPQAHTEEQCVADLQAVLDATCPGPAVLVGLCGDGVWRSLWFAADHPERVLGIVAISVGVPYIAPPHPFKDGTRFDQVLDSDEGWAKYNRHYWLRDYPGFVEFFFSQMFPEPHSTKQIEDCVRWATETTVEVMLAAADAPFELSKEDVEAICRRVRAPLLIVHGENDNCQPHARAERLAELTGAPLVTLERSGHIPSARDPVKVNLLIKEFADRATGTAPPAARWTRARNRRRRALYLSSPIGLGHARRDLAVARHLRELRPDLEIEWLAQDPVTRLLETAGETIHPASRLLASESAHWQSESTDHDLNAFQALRRMDEILVANFMLFHEVVTDGSYDLVVGDEAWDVDYFWHENPELKRTAFCWMTDFVGLLPMPEGGDHEAALTADYNAEMLEQVARFPRVRDRAIFVGNPDDIVPHAFGPNLPTIREWTEQHYAFAGYVTGFDPADLGEREELRERLGYRTDQRVVLVTVGGSGVGRALLRRVVAAFPQAASAVDGLRMIAVAGPRIDPASLEPPTGVEVLGYVPDLHHHLAACDLAVVQGGLSTCMELTATRRPFLYFPLRNHFEQNLHVAHRLDRYHAGHRMDYTTATPDLIATTIAKEINRPVHYRPVETNGAPRAAAMIAELL